jgi:xanthine dehydrogenase YagT iron-sulfur-binding subunit
MNESESNQTGSFSRRTFLKSVGTTAVGAAAVQAQTVAAELEKINKDKIVGPGDVPLTLKVNGQSRKLAVEPRVTLLDALRNRLDLTGPKKVCDRGTCGACTVLVDGHPVYSCSLLALEAEGHEITTIEGLGTPEKLSEVQKAFVEHDGQQCGFCTPGFVTACTAFVRTHPNASLEDVRAGLGGNLCRCGTYAGIMLAAVDAAKNTKGGA